MATYGKVKAFNPKVDDWEIYEEQLRFFMAANNITDATKKCSILLTVCGDQTFKLLRSLVPDGRLDAEDVTYDSLIQLLRSHYKKKQSVVVHRFNFNTRLRKTTETLAEYVAALRELALNCKFGSQERLEEMLRDRLVCGINHAGIQRKLLSEGDLSFSEALAFAQAIETAEQDAKKLGSAVSQQPATVNFIPKSGKSPSSPQTPPTCYRCGGPHLATHCRHKETQCNYCKINGHLARVCRARARAKEASFPRTPTSDKKPPKKTYHVQEDPQEDSTSEDEYGLNTVRGGRSPPYTTNILLNDIPVEMEIDTGADVTIITQDTFEKLQQAGDLSLEPANSKLKTYTGEDITVLGVVQLMVRYNSKQLSLSVHVVSGSGPNLLGRDLITTLGVSIDNLKEIRSVDLVCSVQEVVNSHASVFSEELGCYNGPPVKLKVHDNAKPKFYKARSAPFSLKSKIEAELDSLQSKSIISPVKHSAWATPIVPVLKKNGKVRICGDYKLTVNQASPTETYPLPLIDELFTSMSGGKYFSKLDLENAYLQLPLDSASKQFVTINTHRGLFQYNRLPFGVASAPAVFQRHMEMLLQGLDGVSVYLDDIVVAGRTIDEHHQRLAQVLERLENARMRLNKQKCSFLRSSIEYLGHVVDEKGIHPTKEKVTAIREAPAPTNVTQLRSFLGLINYYNKFLPNLAASLTPLYSLLNKQQKWAWNTEQQTAFEHAKEALQSDTLLTHHNPAKPLILACDASEYGIGAVLSHVIDNQERPIAYVSRTLSTAEKHYSQLEKEALAIVFAVKKLHRYLLGRHFTIESDHQPLKTLFGETNKIPNMAPSRIVRWAVILSAYNYTIRYKSGKRLCNADALSRLPQPVTTAKDCVPADVVAVIDHLSTTAVDARAIKEWTAKDPTLSCVHRFLLSGWPTHKLNSQFQPYVSRKNELSVLDGCVLWSSRIIVPPQGRQPLLEELHNTHLGASKMKALARCYIWWPGMDQEIDNLVKSCSVCQESRPAPAIAPLHSWEWPTEPWSRLHLDFAGPFLGHMFLILVDAHSKWLDVHQMQSITSANTIEKLRAVFATHGLPRKVVTDNGSSFTSEEFRSFMSENGITYVTTAPYHPSSNGLAERAVQTFKRGLKATKGQSLQERLSKFLFTYRISPHTTTGVAPAQLLMNRRLRSRFDRLFPDLQQRVQQKQAQQAVQHDNSKPLRSFAVGDSVYTRDFSASSPTWIPGTVVKVTGPLSYHIKLMDGGIVRRHVDAVRTRETSIDPTPLTDFPWSQDTLYMPTGVTPPQLLPPPPPPVPPVRRSTRVRIQPSFYGH